MRGKTMEMAAPNASEVSILAGIWLPAQKLSSG